MEKLILTIRDGTDTNIAKELEVEFNKIGQPVEISTVSSLAKVREMLEEDACNRIIVLISNLEFTRYLTKDYLEIIRKNYPKLVIVSIIEDRYCKSSYLQDLLETGIYNGVFKKDASISNIVYISLNPRTKKEAEGYYGLDHSENETERIYKRPERRPLMLNNKSKNNVAMKERVVYKTPLDYKKIIGIYSPYSVGKTVLAVNLARYYEKNKINVTLIDTDYYKKDTMYYFPLESNDYLKMKRLYNNLKLGKEINDISDYEINIKKNLKLFTDHRDSIYNITYSMISFIVRSCNSNIVIIDISKDLDKQLINEILNLCDERIIVADKMMSTLNGLPYKLALSGYNIKKLNLVINKDVSLKSLTNKEIVHHFKNINNIGREKYNIDFNNVFCVPDKFHLIAESLANREPAYGKDKDFDESINKIGTEMYHMISSKKRRKNILNNFFEM